MLDTGCADSRVCVDGNKRCDCRSDCTVLLEREMEALVDIEALYDSSAAEEDLINLCFSRYARSGSESGSSSRRVSRLGAEAVGNERE